MRTANSGMISGGRSKKAEADESGLIWQAFQDSYLFRLDLNHEAFL